MNTNNVETEIKLRASHETLQALREHPLLSQGNNWQRLELGNQYYDTANQDLARNKVALRVRKDGDQFLQTLKSRGRSVAGFSERDEWNWPLDSNQLDLSRLTDECWPAALAGLQKSDLMPVFRTDFVRQKTEISRQVSDAQITLEVALDLGQVVAGQEQEEICELELELHQGEPTALLAFAAELAHDLPLMPCDISKAERGYRLFNADSYPVSLPSPSLDGQQNMEQSFATLAWYLLGSSQRLAEQYRFNGNWKLIHNWLEQLIELRALLGSLGQAVPRASSHELRQTLDGLITDWQPLLSAGEQDPVARAQAVRQFADELLHTRWGRWSLQLAQWLLSKGWQQQRNSHGNQLAQLPLERWMPQQLRAECSKLHLARWHDNPLGLSEQLPRLLRVLVWLHHARDLLAIADADRLYGELDKLGNLLRQPDALSRAEQLSQQVKLITALPAWKSLAH